jgi:DNA-binding CsgD family transcriptional regulator
VGNLPDSLLDQIYDAAADERCWVPALQRMAALTGGTGGILFLITRKPLLGAVQQEYNGGLDEACGLRHRERHLRNPWSRTMVRQPVGKLVMSEQILTLPALRRTAFYDEVLYPQGVGYNAMACVGQDANFLGAFNICRDEARGPFKPEQEMLQQQLLPHVHRALSLGKRLEGYRALQDPGYRVLDQLSSGIVLLGPRHQVVLANRAALRLLSADGLLRITTQGLRARSMLHQRMLDTAMSAVASGVPSQTVRITRPNGYGPLNIVIVSVRGNDRDRFAMRLDVCMMVFVTEPLDSPFRLTAAVTESFGFTFAEAKVAALAAQGAQVREIAVQLTVSPNTVKTHLRRVYEKAGVHRQAQLVRLLLPEDLQTPVNHSPILEED